MNITVDGVTRPMTEAEYAAHQQLQADIAAEQAEHEASIAAKIAARESAKAKLAALGLTEDEVNAIIGGV